VPIIARKLNVQVEEIVIRDDIKRCWAHVNQNKITLSTHGIKTLLKEGMELRYALRLLVTHEMLHLAGFTHKKHRKYGYYSNIFRDKMTPQFINKIFGTGGEKVE